MNNTTIFKYAEDRIANTIALSILCACYLGGWWLLSLPQIILNGLGVLMLAESMVLAGFFVHEFAHGSIFQSGRWNRLAGKCCLWITFHGFFSFTRIQQLHIAHHRNHADVIHFDFHNYLVQHPLQRNGLIILEWCYIPAVELFIKWHSIQRIWQTQIQTEQQLIFTAVSLYSGLVLTILWLNPSVFIGLLLAYGLFIHVLRFMDMHQHTYQAYVLDDKGNIPSLPTQDKNYEQENTYSNVFSLPWSGLNWLTLNFGYHNAHHAKPFMPWCRLPQLHRTLGYKHRELSAWHLLSNYHQFRVQRVINANIGKPVMELSPSLQASEFHGVIGASFLNA